MEKNNDFFKVAVARKKGKLKIEKNFCSLECANRWNLTHRQDLPFEETLEEEIREAIEEETEQPGKQETKQAEAEKTRIPSYKEKNLAEEVVSYQKISQAYSPKSGGTEYIENKEFYVKNNFDAVENTMKEIKSQFPSISNVDDSDLWEIEPETKKLKVRKMPRNMLDMFKQKGILVDYFKIL